VTLPPGDVEGAGDQIRDGSADAPADWPRLAVAAGYADSREAYYDHLHEATVATAAEAISERERAGDQQLKHAIRAMDDCTESANELAERLAEWGGTVDPDAGTGVDYARTLVDRDSPPAEPQLLSLASRVAGLADEADSLRTYVEEHAPAVAPNLSALAGPVLAARLISLAGGLESLAKKPSGTIQVLGAEDALFAHLHGNAPSPKHGAIYTHDAVRNTRDEDRGSAARALAGKLAIAARVDHYSGTHRPELVAEFEDRMETIRARDPDVENTGYAVAAAHPAASQHEEETDE
jgi:nucleolar protein 56